MTDSWAIARECCLERGSEIAEIAEAAAPLDVDAQAVRSFGTGEVFDVGHAVLADDETERIVAQYTTVTPTSERCARVPVPLIDTFGWLSAAGAEVAVRFGIRDDDDLDSPAGFAAWVHERIRLAHPAGTVCPKERHGSPRWIVDDGQVLEGIVLRHIPDDNVGHIGYSVRPTARRRGLASWALGQMLGEARTALGVDRVLIPCLADNFASARTIERSGGFLEGICDTERGPIRRYWIALDR